MHSDLRLHQLNPERILKTYLDTRLNSTLSRFAGRLGRITARLSAASGAGNEVQCHITADARPFGVINSTAQDVDVIAAIDRCIGRLARQCQSKFARSRNRRSARVSIRNTDDFAAA